MFSGSLAYDEDVTNFYVDQNNLPKIQNKLNRSVWLNFSIQSFILHSLFEYNNSIWEYLHI